MTDDDVTMPILVLPDLAAVQEELERRSRQLDAAGRAASVPTPRPTPLTGRLAARDLGAFDPARLQSYLIDSSAVVSSQPKAAGVGG